MDNFKPTLDINFPKQITKLFKYDMSLATQYIYIRAKLPPTMKKNSYLEKSRRNSLTLNADFAKERKSKKYT